MLCHSSYLCTVIKKAVNCKFSHSYILNYRYIATIAYYSMWHEAQHMNLCAWLSNIFNVGFVKCTQIAQQIDTQLKWLHPGLMLFSRLQRRNVFVDKYVLCKIWSMFGWMTCTIVRIGLSALNCHFRLLPKHGHRSQSHRSHSHQTNVEKAKRLFIIHKNAVHDSPNHKPNPCFLMNLIMAGLWLQKPWLSNNFCVHLGGWLPMLHSWSKMAEKQTSVGVPISFIPPKTTCFLCIS